MRGATGVEVVAGAARIHRAAVAALVDVETGLLHRLQATDQAGDVDAAGFHHQRDAATDDAGRSRRQIGLGLLRGADHGRRRWGGLGLLRCTAAGRQQHGGGQRQDGKGKAHQRLLADNTKDGIGPFNGSLDGARRPACGSGYCGRGPGGQRRQRGGRG
ncbi:hypothetical protein G6F60_014176 [Rhizopus arrhizus]|nr:hypothetical protein G6F60_014176 [Rhizopus arrhizus]